MIAAKTSTSKIRHLRIKLCFTFKLAVYYISHPISRASKQISLRYCCLRFSYKDSINIILKFAIEFFPKKKHKKTRSFMLRRIVGAKYTKEPNNFFLQFKYLDSDFNNIN